jgi:hypothetical protein
MLGFVTLEDTVRPTVNVALQLDWKSSRDWNFDWMVIWVCWVGALIDAVLRAVLPHPAHVLDWIIILRDTVIVDLGNTCEEGGPSERDVSPTRVVYSRFRGNPGRCTTIASCQNVSLVERFHDIAERLHGIVKAVVLVEG